MQLENAMDEYLLKSTKKEEKLSLWLRYQTPKYDSGFCDEAYYRKFGETLAR